MAFDPYSPWARAISIVARTFHLVAMALLVGGIFAGLPDAEARTWGLFTVGTGLVLLVTEVTHGRHWVYQGRGVATIAHMGAYGLLLAGATSRVAAITAIVIGAVGSHMPGKLRKWSLRHGRVVD